MQMLGSLVLPFTKGEDSNFYISISLKLDTSLSHELSSYEVVYIYCLLDILKHPQETISTWNF